MGSPSAASLAGPVKNKFQPFGAVQDPGLAVPALEHRSQEQLQQQSLCQHLVRASFKQQTVVNKGSAWRVFLLTSCLPSSSAIFASTLSEQAKNYD